MVYGASDYEKVFGEFQKKYPEIKVTFVGAGEKPPALAQRLIAERRANQYLADLYVAGAWTAHSALYKPKALDPIKPVLILPEVVDQTKWWEGRHHYVDADGQYIFAFNGEMFPPPCTTPRSSSQASFALTGTSSILDGRESWWGSIQLRDRPGRRLLSCITTRSSARSS